MFLVNQAMVDLNVGTAGLIALLGYAVVFVGLIEVKLFDVADKEAAMLMAIVANKLGKPLNELRFKSIKEVK